MKNVNTRKIILETIQKKKGLSMLTAFVVALAVLVSLFPPMILGKIVDRLAEHAAIPVAEIFLYFGLLAAAYVLESLREAGLIVFGQKMTHALRSKLMEKLTRLNAESLNALEPGNVAARFVGDVDTVEKLFTGGVVGLLVDACKILGIFMVIFSQNRGLALILLVLIPILFGFTRFVQRKMLASQIENRRAVGRASAFVPETILNIRTIHALGCENHMEEKYDQYIEQGYRATEKTNLDRKSVV